MAKTKPMVRLRPSTQVKTDAQYEAAKNRLRKHYAKCNCFLPNTSCYLWVEQLEQDASDYWNNRETKW